MLARNNSLKGTSLSDFTKDQILKTHARGYNFVVGDMLGVDSQFIDYLQEIGAKFTIYHTGKESRIKINGNKVSKTGESVSENLIDKIEQTEEWQGINCKGSKK